MEVFEHNLANLFSQLGINEKEVQFIAEHSLKDGQKLTEAPFWTPTQKQFLAEALADDADWCEVIDQLDMMLRE
ncbi:DUF2789 domain-containing protein [Vibrio sp. Of7-15]|uniref:DUF2789 family protein n=1 Tax=Vibrio sp. Of7-15 TaxID=2724879 RepID=UPI001EF2D023|nr:DUF2789 family protein [Vibrio sp. Of7-15]MCG7498378.1 DUF2789 domain-containing protein [Vibrio sp. Of7-15]